MRRKFELFEGVPEETFRLMVVMGCARLADDGIYELTEAGAKWLREWCEQKTAEHEASS